MSKMQLWLLCEGADQDKSWDIATGFVVRASSESRARALAAQQAGDEGAAYWRDPNASTCVPLRARGKCEVVLRDFKTG